MAINTNAEMLEKITLEVQNILETTMDISLGQDLLNLGLDSLKCVAMIVKLEESFNIVFEDEELLFEYFSTIQRIADKVAEKIE